MQEALQMIDLWGYLKIIDAYLNGRLDDKELMQQLGRTISRDAAQLIIHFKANLKSELNKTIDHEVNEELGEMVKQQVDEVDRCLDDFLLNRIDHNELIIGLLGIAKESIPKDLMHMMGINQEDMDLVLNADPRFLMYAVFCILYSRMMGLLQEARLVHEERLRIEKACQEAVEKIVAYRTQLQVMVSDYLEQNIDTFSKGLEAMDQAIALHDSNQYIRANETIQQALGYHMQYHDQQEFDDLMDSDLDFKL